MVTVTVESWFSAYLLTQAVEMPIYLVATRGKPWRARWMIAAAASTLTHPMVWFVIPGLGWPNYDAYLMGAESFAFAVEALLLWCLAVPRPMLWSLFANAGSVIVGLTLRELFGWP